MLLNVSVDTFEVPLEFKTLTRQTVSYKHGHEKVY